MWPSPLRDRAVRLRGRSIRLVGRHRLIARIGMWAHKLRQHSAPGSLPGPTAPLMPLEEFAGQAMPFVAELPLDSDRPRLSAAPMMPDLPSPSAQQQAPPSHSGGFATLASAVGQPQRDHWRPPESTPELETPLEGTTPVPIHPPLAAPPPTMTRPATTDAAAAQASSEVPEALRMPPPAAPGAPLRPRPRRAIIEEMPTPGSEEERTPPDAPRAARPSAPPDTASDPAPPVGEPLFTPNATDRSPEAWLARLRQGGSAQPQVPTDDASSPIPTIPPAPPIVSSRESPPDTSPAPPADTPQAAARPLTSPASPVPMASKAPGVDPARQGEITDRASPPSADPAASLQTAGPHAEPASSGGELFQAPAGVDRSPRVWAERLRGAETPAPYSSSPRQTGETSPDLPATSPEALPEVLPDAAIRFLRPLAGVDPATVRVFRGAVAADTVAARRADALAIGQDVVLGASTSATPAGPEQLGLVAHELAHVARQRDPTFVPPVLRGVTPSQGEAASMPPEQAQPASAGDQPAEESLARQVEQHVTGLARAWVARQTGVPPDPTRTPLPTPATADQPAADVSEPTPPAGPPRQVARRSSPSIDWGGLPAPWEPLPNWVTTAPEPAPTPAPGPSTAPRTPARAETAAPAVMAAEQGRPALAPPSPGEGAVAPEAGGSDELDLDAVAQQVYRRLQRRLAAERRRLG